MTASRLVPASQLCEKTDVARGKRTRALIGKVGGGVVAGWLDHTEEEEWFEFDDAVGALRMSKCEHIGGVRSGAQQSPILDSVQNFGKYP